VRTISSESLCEVNGWGYTVQLAIS